MLKKDGGYRLALAGTPVPAAGGRTASMAALKRRRGFLLLLLTSNMTLHSAYGRRSAFRPVSRDTALGGAIAALFDGHCSAHPGFHPPSNIESLRVLIVYTSPFQDQFCVYFGPVDAIMSQIEPAGPVLGGETKHGDGQDAEVASLREPLFRLSAASLRINVSPDFDELSREKWTAGSPMRTRDFVIMFASQSALVIANARRSSR